MQHLKEGDLIALEDHGRWCVFLILSKSAFFGCQWAFALYQTFGEIPPVNSLELSPNNGFVALIDFIEPRRENKIVRIDKGMEIERCMSFQRMKALIRKHPPDGTALWYIYDRNFSILEKKKSLLPKELDYPIASGMKADRSFQLITSRWSPRVLVAVSDSGHYPNLAASDSIKAGGLQPQS